MDLEQKIEAMSEAQWKRANVIGGIALGLVIGVVLFILSAYKEFGAYAFIGAVLLALFTPRFIQGRVSRSVRAGQIAMLFTIAACMGMYLVYAFAIK